MSQSFKLEFYYYAPAEGALSDDAAWQRLSVAYTGSKSRTERPKETEIGTEVAHVTPDSDTTFKVIKSKVKVKCEAGAYCAHLQLVTSEMVIGQHSQHIHNLFSIACMTCTWSEATDFAVEMQTEWITPLIPYTTYKLILQSNINYYNYYRANVIYVSQAKLLQDNITMSHLFHLSRSNLQDNYCSISV